MSVIHGAAHDAGLYWVNTPGTGSFINDGIQLIADLNMEVVLLFMSENFSTVDYALEDWTGESATNLTELAQTTPFATAFSNQVVDNFILNIFPFTTNGVSDLWKFGLADQPNLLSNEYTECYNLASHLLTTYAGTGMTFILQNWEGDWPLQNSFDVLDWTTITGRQADLCQAYFRARYQGIADARRAIGSDNVRVLSAYQCNRPRQSRFNRGLPGCLNLVIPRLRGLIDFVSWSAYDGVFNLPPDPTPQPGYYSSQAEMLMAIADVLPAMIDRLSDAADCPCIIGEWGIDELQTPVGYSDADIIQAVYDVVEAKDIPFHIYWEVLNNEPGRLYALYDSLGALTNAGTKWQSLLTP